MKTPPQIGKEHLISFFIGRPPVMGGDFMLQIGSGLGQHAAGVQKLDGFSIGPFIIPKKALDKHHLMMKGNGFA